jgi:hypothetical protein
MALDSLGTTRISATVEAEPATEEEDENNDDKQ